MEPSFSLRPATTEDIGHVLEIETHVHRTHWNEAHFRAELTKPYSHFLLMTDDETDNEVAGYIIFWTLFDECQILNLAVSLPFRGVGLAREMLKKAAALS